MWNSPIQNRVPVIPRKKPNGAKGNLSGEAEKKVKNSAERAITRPFMRGGTNTGSR